MTELVYREVGTRSVDATNFTAGLFDFNFSTGQPTSWIPSKSYFRITMEIRGATGAVQPTSGEKLAFADNAPNCLFDNVICRAGGQDISSSYGYVPQSAQAKMRLQRTGAWLNTIGKDAYMLEPSMTKRISKFSYSPVTGDDYERVDICEAGESTCTLAIASADGTVVGVRTVLNTVGLKIGDFIYANGYIGTITTLATAGVGTNMVLNPEPSADIAATTNVYAMRKRNGGSQNKTFALWKPSIGLFDHDKPMGAGDYRITLNPYADYKTACVESIGVATSASPVDFNVIVTDIKFYLATIKMSIPSGIETLHLMETTTQSKTAVNGSTLDFTVPSSTRGLAVFVQASTSGKDTRIPPTAFRCLDGGELKLQSLQITYANVTKPSTRWASDYSITSNGMLQRYIDTQIESGLIDSPGGAESFNDWMSRGCLYYYSFDRDAQDKSTNVQVSATFEGGVPDGNANLFLVAFHSRSTEITTQNGSVVAVRSLNV